MVHGHGTRHNSFDSGLRRNGCSVDLCAGRRFIFVSNSLHTLIVHILESLSFKAEIEMNDNEIEIGGMGC